MEQIIFSEKIRSQFLKNGFKARGLTKASIKISKTTGDSPKAYL